MAVRQILNALDLIEYFARTGEPASLAEIQAHFGWPRSSAYNVLSTLVERGYMYEPARRGGYYPTGRWLRTAEALVPGDSLTGGLSKMLAALARETGETAIVAAPAGRQTVYLDVIEPPSPLRYAARPGMRIPIHAAASGRALLSLMTPAERRKLLGRIEFVRYGTNALTSVAAVEDEIAVSRARGWFQSLHEYDADLAAVAVPLSLDGRRLAIAVAGPVSRLGERCAEVAAVIRCHVGDAG